MNAIVIGAGVDGLVAAHLLARKGHRVLVVHERPFGDWVSGWIAPPILRDLSLELAFRRPDPWASVALADGGTLELWQDMGRTVESIRRLSPRDASRWPQFCARMAALARLFAQLYAESPIDPLNLRFALRVRRLGRQGMEDLMRLLPMSAAELLDDWFECDALKGALGAMGILHLQQGPRSGGTAFRLLHHHVGSPAGVFRPVRSNLAEALARRAGVDLRRAEVEKILLKEGRVTGVALAGGEELPASLVVSGIDPRRTLLELADPAWLDPELARALGHLRRRGVVARITFQSAGASRNVVVAPSLNYLERAYDASKYGRISEEPYLEARCEDGRVEVHFQFAPYHLAQGGWDDTRRADLGALVARTLSPHITAIAAPSVEAPPDLERSEGWPEGQAYHAELTLDQALWTRPLPELAHYRTPIEGLWLCGPGLHPGGGIAGACGYNCAREILRRA